MKGGGWECGEGKGKGKEGGWLREEGKKGWRCGRGGEETAAAVGDLSGVRGRPHARGIPCVRREALEPRGVAPRGRVCERSSQEPADRGAEGPEKRRMGAGRVALGGSAGSGATRGVIIF